MFHVDMNRFAARFSQSEPKPSYFPWCHHAGWGQQRPLLGGETIACLSFAVCDISISPFRSRPALTDKFRKRFGFFMVHEAIESAVTLDVRRGLRIADDFSLPIHCAPLFCAASQIASATASASANDSHALMYSQRDAFGIGAIHAHCRHFLGTYVGPVVRIIFQSDAEI